MTDNEMSKRAKWEAPELNEISDGLSMVKNGVVPGSDGDGGYTTSLS